jgi:hypothetical protein
MDQINVHLRSQGERAGWASLTLGLRERAAETSFLTHAPSFQWSIEPLDDQAAAYELTNWESGVISGAGYAFRVLRRPYQAVVLRELKGSLSGGDIGVLSLAASIGVAGLLGLDHSFVQTPGWQVDVKPCDAGVPR